MIVWLRFGDHDKSCFQFVFHLHVHSDMAKFFHFPLNIGMYYNNVTFYNIIQIYNNKASI